MRVPTKLFLDTTIQIERITATHERQREIAEACRGKELVTSAYVLGEYLRTLVADAALLYRLVCAAAQLYDVETRIANLFNQRSASRCLLLWAALHRSGIYDREMILAKLRIYLQYGLVNRFMVGIDEFIDHTDCGLAKERPLLSGEHCQLRTQCVRRVKECELARFLTHHKAEIEILAAGLSAHADRSLARMAELCTLLLEDPDVARGRSCTWYLGDLVIALEAPSEAAIYTTNLRHFEPICALLGKQLYAP